MKQISYKVTKSKRPSSTKSQSRIPCQKCDASIYLPDFGFVQYLEQCQKNTDNQKTLEIE